MKVAFSTVACPTWTLEEVADHAERLGFMGVELRTFGDAPSQFACEPALTEASKVRSMFDKAGVEIACLATSLRFDEPVGDPFLHIFGDNDKPIRAAKSVIDLAGQVECPLVRVFAFETFGSESRSNAVRRIAEKLKLAAAAARNTGVRLILENGGSFATAADLAELLDLVDSPHMGAAYSVATASRAGEGPRDGINVLGDRLALVRMSDWQGTKACALGQGDIPNAQAVSALFTAGYRGWLSYEWPAAWTHASGDVASMLGNAAKALFQWMGSPAKAASAHSTVAAGH